MRDFKFLLNTPEGLMPCLAELKMIGAGKTLLPRGDKGLRAERRAGKLTKEYKSILKRYNICFHRAALMVRTAQAARAGGGPPGCKVLVLWGPVRGAAIGWSVGRSVPLPPPAAQGVCRVTGGRHGQGPGVGGWAQHVGHGDGGGEAGLQRHGGEV